MKILDILSDKLKLSPGEETVFDVWLNALERDALTLAKQSTSTGGGAGVDVGNVVVSLEDGVTLYNPDTGARTIYLDPDGDAWFGNDIDVPGDTALAIFSNTQEYNSEDMGEGDLLIGDNAASKANLFWDKSAGQLQLRSGTTAGIVLDTDGTLQSGNYSHDAAGWTIDPDGNAEFNDITARGKLKSTVFETGAIQAVGGRVWVSKNAGLLGADVTTPAAPGETTILIEDNDDSTKIAQVNDVLAMRTWDGSNLITAYFTVTAIGGTTDGITTYTVDFENGSASTLFTKGAALVNVGPSGAGVIDLEAGMIRTRIRIWTHAGAPWSAVTNHVVIGNVRSEYGTGAIDRYGIGIGNYSSGEYMSYNAATSGKLVIAAAGGKVTLDETGITLTEGVAGDYFNRVSWHDVGDDETAFIQLYTSPWDTLFGYLTSPNTDAHIDWVASVDTSGKGARVKLQATDSASGVAYITVGSKNTTGQNISMLADTITVTGDLGATTIEADNGFDGSWVNNESETVTVVGGIITDVS